jgi:hypothetical protein
MGDPRFALTLIGQLTWLIKSITSIQRYMEGNVVKLAGGKMNIFIRIATATAFVFAAIVPNNVSAMLAPPPPPVVGAGTSSAVGVAVATGFIGFVGSLVAYDIIRRTTCSGDFLNLGGPGFTSPITSTMSIITPPICSAASTNRN